jgi:hypothetical protein
VLPKYKPEEVANMHGGVALSGALDQVRIVPWPLIQASGGGAFSFDSNATEDLERSAHSAKLVLVLSHAASWSTLYGAAARRR